MKHSMMNQPIRRPLTRRTLLRAAGVAMALPFLDAMRPVEGATAAYVCRDFACRQPVTTVDALQQELGTTA